MIYYFSIYSGESRYIQRFFHEYFYSVNLSCTFDALKDFQSLMKICLKYKDNSTNDNAICTNWKIVPRINFPQQICHDATSYMGCVDRIPQKYLMELSLALHFMQVYLPFMQLYNYATLCCFRNIIPKSIICTCNRYLYVNIHQNHEISIR